LTGNQALICEKAADQHVIGEELKLAMV